MAISSATVIDMGEFSLDTGDSKNTHPKPPRDPFQKTGSENTPKGSSPSDNHFVKQAFKETTKIAKRKTDEEVKTHQELVLILSRYGQSKRFSEHLKSMSFNLSVTHLKSCEIDELEEIHKRVKISIDNKNVSNFWEEMCLSSIQTGEAICVNTKLGQKVKIQGLTELLRNDETFLDLIEQIELENQNITHTSPYVRLVYAVVSSAMKVHSVNSMLSKRMAIIQQSQEPTQDPQPVSQEPQLSSQEPETTSQVQAQETEEKEPAVLSFE